MLKIIILGIHSTVVFFAVSLEDLRACDITPYILNLKNDVSIHRIKHPGVPGTFVIQPANEKNDTRQGYLIGLGLDPSNRKQRLIFYDAASHTLMYVEPTALTITHQEKKVDFNFLPEIADFKYDNLQPSRCLAYSVLNAYKQLTLEEYHQDLLPLDFALRPDVESHVFTGIEHFLYT